MTHDELADERTFLLRSLQDLDREHEAGDLSDEDHAALLDAYTARAAAVLRSSEAPGDAGTGGGGPPVQPTPPRPRGRPTPGATRRGGRWRRRRVLVAASVCAVTGVTVALLVTDLSPRMAGQTLTGSVAPTPSQQIAHTVARAEAAENTGDAAGAVRLFQSVLAQDPTEEEALAELGWLEYEAGAQAADGTLLSRGQREEQEAERLGPQASAPHLYLGSMLLAEGNAGAAVAQYRRFLADRPPRREVEAAVPFITKAFTEAHLAPPPLTVGGAGSTSPNG